MGTRTHTRENSHLAVNYQPRDVFKQKRSSRNLEAPVMATFSTVTRATKLSSRHELGELVGSSSHVSRARATRSNLAVTAGCALVLLLARELYPWQ